MMSPLLLAKITHDNLCDSRSFVEECGYLICKKCNYYIEREIIENSIKIGVSDKIPLKGQ